MLKLFKLLFKIIILVVVIDLICVFTINKPLFAIKENNIYKGIFYDVYDCMEYSVPQIKIKGVKFSCIDRTDLDLLKVQKSNKNEIIKEFIINEENGKNNDIYRIYYYGVSSVTLNWNGEKYEFGDAIDKNIVTIEQIIDKIDINKTFWNVGITNYRDGGTIKYSSNSYSIIRCNTLGGNKDIYVGNKDMEYEDNFCELLG